MNEATLFLDRLNGSGTMQQSRPEFKYSFYPTRRRLRLDEGVRRLALAILIQALRDAVKPKSSRDPDPEDWSSGANEWFASDETEPGSYLWACEVLQIEPQRFRDWLGDDSNSVLKKSHLARSLCRLQIPRG